MGLICGFEHTDMPHRSTAPIASLEMNSLHSDLPSCFAIHAPTSCLSIICFQKVFEINAMHSMGAYGPQEPKTIRHSDKKLIYI